MSKKYDLPEKFLSPYESIDTENRIYEMWEQSGLFNPDVCIEKGFTKPDADYFSIVLPPPNVTGILHTGHSLMLTIEDIFVRYARMNGKKSLWIPGTDHAAIATQSKVEKELSKQKIRRHEIGRDEFLKHVDTFAQESHDTIVSQVRKMGASVDWSREAFTLDDQRRLAVNTAFERLYNLGLIYKADRIVNWDPKGQTTISDDEVVREEKKTKFYYFQYGPFVIGTARPETKFADKYIIVHPDDKRYAQYEHMQEFDVEWINGPIKATLIKDEVADMEMGTGAMTITPWHSQVDFELAEKYNLPKVQIIDKYGKLLPIAEEFAGMKIEEARERIVEKLQEKGLVVNIEDNYILQQATAERSGGVIEPQIMDQWWIAVDKEFKLPYSEMDGIKSGDTVTLKQLMQHVVREKQIEILPERFEKTYFHWIDNLRPWNISRQIWYGHRVPVWYKDDEMHVGGEAPDKSGDWVQDEDTLDTWFSSGLWTFSTLGWPHNTDELRTYHPTSMIETGADIIFFWVARMILMSTCLVGQIPFKTVYFHGLVRDEQGRKISKSLGNNIDPVELIEKYGADALRMAQIVAVGPGQDNNLGENKVKAYRKFSNKLWNMSRFILSNLDGFDPDEHDESVILDIHKKYLDELETAIQNATKNIDEYRLHLASEELYHYVWHTVADIVLEECKEALTGDSVTPEERQSAQYVLYTILKTSLKLLHPFMPFITEEIWQSLPHTKSDRGTMLMISPWPTSL